MWSDLHLQRGTHRVLALSGSSGLACLKPHSGLRVYTRGHTFTQGLVPGFGDAVLRVETRLNRVMRTNSMHGSAHALWRRLNYGVWLDALRLRLNCGVWNGLVALFEGLASWDFQAECLT